jgi:hypothetical protein
LPRRRLIVGVNPIPRVRTSKCPSGQILRASYTRRSNSGVKTRIKATCIPGRGLSAIYGSPVRTGIAVYKIKRPRLLRDQGYGENKPASVRHRAIDAAIKKKGALSVIRHMNLIALRSRNRETNREGVRNLAADVKWAGQKYGYPGFARGTLLSQIRRTFS